MGVVKDRGGLFVTVLWYRTNLDPICKLQFSQWYILGDF